MNQRLLLGSVVVLAVFTVGCAPECVDQFDCTGGSTAMTCVAGKCVEATPQGGGSGGGTGTGGGTATGGGGGTEEDAGTDAGTDAGMEEVDAGTDAGMEEMDAGIDDGGVTPGDTLALTSNNRIVSFDFAVGTVRTEVAVTGLQPSENLVGFDMRVGGTPANQILALGSSGRLYTIDHVTGAATLKASLSADPSDTTAPYASLTGTSFGVDFNPVVDRLRVVSADGQNLRINVDTGATITDGTLNIGAVPRTGVTAAAYTNNFAAACRTALYYLDTTTDELFTTTDPNAGTLTLVGALGVDAAATSSFDIVPVLGGGDAAFASLTVSGVTGLYSINLSTGAATLARPIDGLATGESLVGVVQRTLQPASAQAPGDFVGLTDFGGLITFNAAAPQKLCTGPTAIGGLMGTEAALAIDVRPSNNKLYVLGTAGRLYTVDLATGAATFVSTLSADPADLTQPYAGLNGSDFSLDFNPVADRLRIMSNTAQNLRVNVDTGLTTTDGDLTIGGGAGAGVTSAAYTNSFGGALETTIYAIDSMTDSLISSTAPNNGTYTSVGALGASLTNNTAFEIAGQSNLAYVAAEVTGTPGVSSLFSVNLTTGAATRINTIGGGQMLLGFTSRTAQVAEVFAVTANAHLVSFSPPTPGTLTSDVPLTGLSVNESLLGIDFRPATGQLWGLTTNNRLVVIDLTTGAAMSPLVLAPATNDSFTTLQGEEFGIDFNPTVDRLRIVSTVPPSGIQVLAQGENLRVNPADGRVTTDSRFGGLVAHNLFGVAYTNSFAGAATTTIYYVDSATDFLQTSTTPNMGNASNVGTVGLGIDVTPRGDIDIAGLANNLVLGAFQVQGQPASGLYRVNLTTGAATLVAGINIASPVTGVAVRIR